VLNQSIPMAELNLTNLWSEPIKAGADLTKESLNQR